jgi:hypothetical protein
MEGEAVECGRAVNLFNKVWPFPLRPTHGLSEKVLTPSPCQDGSIVNFGGLFPSLIYRPKKNE